MFRIYSIMSIMICFAFSMQANAQYAPLSVVSVAGDVMTDGKYEFTYTVGEMAAIGSFTSDQYLFTQGFSQPSEFESSNSPVETQTNASFYPIPATETLTIEYLNAISKPTFKLYDMKGVLVKEYTSSEEYNTHFQLDISSVASGIYSLQYTAIDINNTAFNAFKRIVIAH